MRTVLEVIQATSEFFGKRGVESPRLNVEHLLAHTLGLKRLQLYLEFDRPLTEAVLAPLRELVRRRADGEPLQHLMGTAEFYGRTFRCDRRALIPRPETEQFVELILERLPALTATQPAGQPLRIADIGTGTGVIACTLALALPDAIVNAIDISPAALELARENAAALGLTDRPTFTVGDLLASADVARASRPLATEGEDDRDGRATPQTSPESAPCLDLVVANLPYIPSGDIASLAREVQFDPRDALDGGADGLDLVRRLLPQAGTRLRPGGVLGLEIGHDQGEAVRQLLSTGGWDTVEHLSDYQGKQRFVFAARTTLTTPYTSLATSEAHG